MASARDDVTVVVVPRERFSLTRESLESIYERTPGLRHLVYIDGASPAATRTYLERESEKRGFVYVRARRYLSPNEARNLGLRHVRTPYVVFVDNDVIVDPDWLERLYACAVETGAAIVGPLCQIDVGGRVLVHIAGGEAHIVEQNGKRLLYESHAYDGTPASATPAFKRVRCKLVEFHTMLVRVDVFLRTGMLDERLLSLNEHVDFCMTVRQLGETVYFEPKSIITYVPSTRLRPSDLPFFLLRWSENWNRSTSVHFNAKWRLSGEHPQNRAVVEHCRYHRQRCLRVVRAAGAPSWPAKVRQRAAIVLERAVNACVSRRATLRLTP